MLKAHGNKEENQSSEPQGPVVVTCVVSPQEEEIGEHDIHLLGGVLVGRLSRAAAGYSSVVECLLSV